MAKQVPTRWNSCFEMLQRMLVLRRAIDGEITDDKMLLTQNEWKNIGYITEVLAPFKTVSETLCASKYPTMSYVYLAIMNLMKNLDEEQSPSPNPVIAKFKKAIKENMIDHFTVDESQKLLMYVCCFVDPR